MTLPVNVGDKIHNGQWYTPAVVASVVYIGPVTEEDREQAQWLGYMLRPSVPYIQIKYLLPNGGYGWKSFHPKLHDGMLLPADMTPEDPDTWNLQRCKIVERAMGGQLDLFDTREYRQLDLFEVAL